MSTDLDALRILLELTRDGKIEWRQKEADRYDAQIGEETVRIEFHRCLRANDCLPDADIVEVAFPRIISTYFSGTEGMRLVGEILAAGMPEWRRHAEHIAERWTNAKALLKSV